MQRRFIKGGSSSSNRLDPCADSNLFEKAQLLSKKSPVKAVAYREKLSLENGSIDSSEFSSNPSCGSCDEVDSFVNASISGILSEDGVSSSNYLGLGVAGDDPAHGKPTQKERHSNISRNLPRFTVNTTRTRALLGAQPVFQKRKIKVYADPYGGENSQSSAKTPPLTPNSSEVISVYSSSHKKNHPQDVILFMNAIVSHDEDENGFVAFRGEEFQKNTQQKQVIIPTNPISKSIRIQSTSNHVVASSAPGNESFHSSSESSLSNPDEHHHYPSNSNSKTGDFHEKSKGHSYSKAAIEVELWKEILMTRVSRLGPHDLAIASGLNELGAAHIRNKQNTEALAVYKKAARILRQHHGDLSLAVAHALDKVALAASLCPATEASITIENSSTIQQHGENLEWGLVAIKEAFKIRLHFLGPWHVDVVDTLNNLAGIYLRRNEKVKAYDAYLQVLTVRIAIFGRNHASVAITAQILGSLSTSMANFSQAMNYFKVCLNIYKRGMNLKDGHPLVQQTYKRMDNLIRLRSMTTLNV